MKTLINAIYLLICLACLVLFTFWWSPEKLYMVPVKWIVAFMYGWGAGAFQNSVLKDWLNSLESK